MGSAAALLHRIASPPAFAHAADERAAKLLTGLTLLIGVGTPVAVVLAGDVSTRRLAAAPILILASLLCNVLVRRGAIRIAIWAFLALLFLAATASLMVSGGVRSIGVLPGFLVVVLAAALRGRRGLLVSSGLFTVALIAAHESEQRGLIELVPETTSASLALVQRLLVLALLSLTMFVYVGLSQAAFEAHERTEDELLRTVQRSDEQREQVQAANEQLQAFAYASSHDLRSPMTTIGQALSMIETDLAEDRFEDLPEYLARGRRATERAITLIEGVLAFSQVLDVDHQPEEIDGDKLVEGVLEDLASDLQAGTVEITNEPVGPVQADPVQLQILVHNLLSNAIKFRHPDRTHRVHLARSTTDDGSLVLQVRDTGIGIPDELTDRAFELFGRLHPQSVYPGTGIGLAMCKRIALNHGGSIDVAPNPGGGTVFTVILPQEVIDVRPGAFDSRAGDDRRQRRRSVLPTADR